MVPSSVLTPAPPMTVASRSTISSRIASWFDASLPQSGPRGHQLTVCRRHVFLMRFFGQSEDRNLCKICAEPRQSRPSRGTQRTCRSRLNSPTRSRRRSRVRRRCRSGTSGRRGENRGTSTHPREQNGTKSLNSPQKFGLLRSVQCGKCLNSLAGATGLEPATSGVTGRAEVEQYQRFSNFCRSKSVP
jgi:hypothetical protein